MTQILTTGCCCGDGEPSIGCPSAATCTACGDLVWSVEGNLIRELLGGGGGFIQRETWSLTSVALRTRSDNPGGCRWLNNSLGGGSDPDFLGFAGTYVLELAGGTIRAVSFNFPPVTGPPISAPNQSPWGTDSQCSNLAQVESFIFRIGGTGPFDPDWNAPDQFGVPRDVAFGTLVFARPPENSCPIGTYDFVVPGDGQDYIQTPTLRSSIA